MNKYFKFPLLVFAMLVFCSFLNGCDTQVEPITIQNNSQENAISSAKLVSISVSGELSKKLYFAGEEFDKTSLTITAFYENGTSKTVSDYTTDFLSTISNGKTLTISYTEDGITKTTAMQGFYYVAAADALTSAPVKYDTIDITINGTTRTYDLLKFGDFPQTVVPLDSTITYSSETVYNDWYLGDDGYFYAQCAENGNTIRDNQYTDNTSVLRNGTNYRYFKVEPIKWRVITNDHNGKKLLLAENILINCMYYDNSSNRNIDDSIVYPTNYEHSKLRAYLNGLSYTVNFSDIATTEKIDKTHDGKGFLQAAFSSAAQDLIATTTVNNSARSTNTDTNDKQFNNGINIYASDTPTYDKIFLLSTQEATSTSYGFDSKITRSSSRIKITTDFAKANGSFQEPDEGGWWWLRSPYSPKSNNKLTSFDISSYGQILEGALGSGGADSGIVPALCLE